MKKAQISMNMIVYIAIALLILVLIVAFVSGGFTQMFAGISRTAPKDLESIRSVCTNDCSKAKAAVDSIGTTAWKRSNYCDSLRKFDSDNSGDISTDEAYNCWESPINVDCSATTLAYVDTVDEDGNTIKKEELVTCNTDSCISGICSPL